MPEMPPPMNTPDIDVRNFDSFMLNTDKLMASELWALSTGEEFKAAMGLWCRAWKQVPAGSLPSDERVLAGFAGVAPNRWRKIREMALRGWVLCADGRLYHQVLCEDARRAMARKVTNSERARLGGLAKAAKDRPASSMLEAPSKQVPEQPASSACAPAKPLPERAHRQDRDNSMTSTVVTDGEDPRLVAVAAAGGYLTFQGEDFTGRWLADLGDDTVERIGEVMDWGRRRTGKPVRLPAYYCEHRKTLLEYRREQATKERQRAEADAHKVQEAERNSQRAREAAAAQAEARCFVAALLAVYREDQDGWATRLTTDQAEILGKLRDLYDGNRGLSLSLMTMRVRLPAALLEAAQARATDTPAEVAP